MKVSRKGKIKIALLNVTSISLLTLLMMWATQNPNLTSMSSWVAGVFVLTAIGVAALVTFTYLVNVGYIGNYLDERRMKSHSIDAK